MIEPIKILLAVCAVLVFLCAALAFLYAVEKKRRKKSDADKEAWKDSCNRMTRRVELLEGELRIKGRNREEADARIENIHNGDSVANALDVLRKHKD